MLLGCVLFSLAHIKYTSKMKNSDRKGNKNDQKKALGTSFIY